MAKTKTAAQFKVQKGNKKKLAIIIILSIMLLVVIFSIMIAADLFSFSLEKEKVKRFDVQDKCSLIVGRLIHVVRDADDCRINCRAECGVRRYEFVQSNFTEQINECNQCACYCK